MSEFSLLVIDIGKTNLKASACDVNGDVLIRRTSPGLMSNDSPYPSFDTEAIWRWLVTTIAEIADRGPVRKLCVAAHGAAAVLLKRTASGSALELAMPIMDYEWDGVREFDDSYDVLRPKFSESFSPSLPVGLNLGRQIHWQSQKFPQQFSSVECILPYAQYWALRFSGIAACERSALGSHTDLWAPLENSWSSLVEKQGWGKLFAPLRPAGQVLGEVLSAVAVETGLNSDCRILTGVHDSSASCARFSAAPSAKRPAVVSTGTWVVTLNPGGALARLDEHRDMLANVDLSGHAVACARFMGGREYAEILARVGDDKPDLEDFQRLQNIIDNGVFALPDFGSGSGPCAGKAGRILGHTKDGDALACLYLALMIDLELELLGADQNVIIEGRFAENEALCRLVASLRPEQSIRRIDTGDGVVQGCWSLADTDDDFEWENQAVSECHGYNLEKLQDYKRQWRRSCAAQGGQGNDRDTTS